MAFMALLLPTDSKALYTTLSHSAIHTHIHTLVMASHVVATAALGRSDRAEAEVRLTLTDSLATSSLFAHMKATNRCTNSVLIREAFPIQRGMNVCLFLHSVLDSSFTFPYLEHVLRL